jgi:hypothetical protein
MPQVDVPRQRLRFDEILHQSGLDGSCRVGVRLEWCGRTLEATSQGLETHHGRIRAAAAATLEAAVAAAGKRIHLELLGVKAVRAFDGWVVVVRVSGEAGGRQFRLLGSASCEDEGGLPKAAVHSVLDATNRLLERYVGG